MVQSSIGRLGLMQGVAFFVDGRLFRGLPHLPSLEFAAKNIVVVATLRRPKALFKQFRLGHCGEPVLLPGSQDSSHRKRDDQAKNTKAFKAHFYSLGFFIESMQVSGQKFKRLIQMGSS